MSAPQKFDVQFVYPDDATAEAALAAANAIGDTVFGTLTRSGPVIEAKEHGVFPSGMYEPTLVAISVLARTAFAGTGNAWHEGEANRHFPSGQLLPGVSRQAHRVGFILTEFLCGRPFELTQMSRLTASDRKRMRTCHAAMTGLLRERLDPIVAQLDARDAKRAEAKAKADAKKLRASEGSKPT